MPSPRYEEGTYRANITGQRFGQTPSGTDYLEFDIQPTEALGMNNMPEQATPARMTFWFTEKSVPFSIDKLRRMGWNGTKLFNLDPSSPDHESLSGTQIVCICGRNQKGYEDWDLAPEGGKPPAESNPSIAQKLDKLWGKALKTSTAKQEPMTVPADAGDDEIPF